MRILITGVDGFIGRALAGHLSKRFEVVGLARKRAKGDGFLVKTFDLPDRVPPLEGFDACIHTAAMTDASLCERDQDKAFAVNVEGTRAIVTALKSGSENAQFIYLSSGGVYGYGSKSFTETAPLRPFNTYLRTKRAGERIALRYLSGPSTVLRLFFPYGPGSREERLVGRIAGRIRSGYPIDLNDGDHPKINPVYVADLCRVIELLLKHPASGVFNVAGPTTVDMRGLANDIGMVLKKKPTFRDTGKKQGDLVGSTVKLKGKLGYAPSTQLRIGLKTTLGGHR